MKRIAFFPATIALALLLSHIGCQFQIKLDGEPEREVFGRQVKQLLETEQLDALEKMANYLRTSKARFPEGLWILGAFYTGLGEPFDPDSEAQWKAWFEKLDRWWSKYPNSKTAAVALSKAYFKYGWKARGTGFAGTVSEEGWQLLKERLAKARKILEETKHLPPEDPQWYVVMLSVALGQSWSDADYDRLYNEAVSKEPTYYDYYFMKANRLLPRWHGNPGDWQRFALEAASKSSKEEGMTLYARIAWGMGGMDYTDNLFTQGGIQWPLMKQGFEDIERNYPNSIWNLNAFCYYACMAKDWDTARKLFGRIGDGFHPWIWKSKVQFDHSKAWAMAGGDEKTKTTSSLSNPDLSAVPLDLESAWSETHFHPITILIACALCIIVFLLYPKLVGRSPRTVEKLCLWIVLFLVSFSVLFLAKLISPGPLHDYFFSTIRSSLTT